MTGATSKAIWGIWGSPPKDLIKAAVAGKDADSPILHDPFGMSPEHTVNSSKDSGHADDPFTSTPKPSGRDDPVITPADLEFLSNTEVLGTAVTGSGSPRVGATIASNPLRESRESIMSDPFASTPMHSKTGCQAEAVDADDPFFAKTPKHVTIKNTTQQLQKLADTAQPEPVTQVPPGHAPQALQSDESAAAEIDLNEQPTASSVLPAPLSAQPAPQQQNGVDQSNGAALAGRSTNGKKVPKSSAKKSKKSKKAKKSGFFQMSSRSLFEDLVDAVGPLVHNLVEDPFSAMTPKHSAAARTVDVDDPFTASPKHSAVATKPREASVEVAAPEVPCKMSSTECNGSDEEEDFSQYKTPSNASSEVENFSQFKTPGGFSAGQLMRSHSHVAQQKVSLPPITGFADC